MAKVPKPSPKSKRSRKLILTSNRLQLYLTVCTLVVAAIAVVMRADQPELWIFLGVIISNLLGQTAAGR
jgi:Na+-translocating ferredoxin:NAD+ oxidoreductase RnfE subunit